MHAATCNENIWLIQHLLKHGADQTMRDNRGCDWKELGRPLGLDIEAIEAMIQLDLEVAYHIFDIE